jgi:ribonuclease HI
MYLRIHTDGGSRGNPGPAAAGVVITNEKGKILFSRGYYLGTATNNVAEYEGLLRALMEATRLGGTELDIYCDSELLVKQINGEYRVKNAKLRPLHRQIMRQLAEFDRTAVQHIYRNDNVEADALVNAVLDTEADVDDLPLPDSRDIKAPPIFTVRYLQELISAAGKRPHREKISEQGNLQSGLICLNPGQSYDMKTDWAEATITVLQGTGTIKTADTEQPLHPHTWIHLSQTDSATITANNGEPLAILVTLEK